MKTITLIIAGFFCSLGGFGQDTIARDTIMEPANHIRLPLNNPAMNLSGTAGGPGQGGNQGWHNAPVPKDTQYCLTPVNGKPRLECNGKKVYKTVKLSDGSQLTSSGKMMMKDGTTAQLRTGECVAQNGEIVRDNEK